MLWPYVHLPMVFVIAATLSGAHAQTLTKQVTASGGIASRSTNASVRGTFGQSVIGYSRSPFAVAHIGFWDPGAQAAKAPLATASGPRSFMLLGNAPNPFPNQTIIRYSIAEKRALTMRIFGESGDIVRTVNLPAQATGVSAYIFDAATLPSGSYNYTLSDGVNAVSDKMVVAR